MSDKRGQPPSRRASAGCTALPLPVRGELAAGSASKEGSGAPSPGLFIESAAGADVRAVAAGQVVWADWLRGFGNLLILDHGDGYMTLYGHNEALVASVGATLQGARRSPGGRVRRDEKPGYTSKSGTTGRPSTPRRGSRGTRRRVTEEHDESTDGRRRGLIGLGTVLGALLTLNFSAIAQRDAKLPIPYEDLQLLSAVFGKIKSDYVEPVSDEKLIRRPSTAWSRGLDPHSDFLDADAFKELQVSTQGKFGGLGIEVGVEDGVVRVVSPIEDTPAFRAGIKSGDLIVKIDDTARAACRCQGRRADARQARHADHAHDRAQGRRRPARRSR